MKYQAVLYSKENTKTTRHYCLDETIWNTASIRTIISKMTRLNSVSVLRLKCKDTTDRKVDNAIIVHVSTIMCNRDTV